MSKEDALGILNALAASAAAVLLGVSNNKIQKGLESFQPNSGRMNIIRTITPRIEIIDDSYNSSPVSLKNALETVSAIKAERLAIAIIGDMLELGESSKLIHFEAGKLIAKSGIDRLYTTGYFAKDIIAGAISNTMPTRNTYIGNKDNITNNIKQYLQSNCLILVKGSRGMKLEEIITKITNILIQDRG